MTRKPKLYSERFGSRGCRVRVYEPRAGANFMLARFKEGKYHAKSLGHRDREKAKADAYALINAIASGQLELQSAADPSKVTVRALVSMYLNSEQFRDLGSKQQDEKRALLEKIVAYLGPTKRIVTLDDDDVRGLLRARRVGTSGFKKPGQQSEYNCFACLRSVILWALEKKQEGGARLLRENPLTGMAKRLKIRPNKTPSQPIVSHATYETLRRGARILPMYVRVFLAMAEGTGRRSSAVRELRWSDVDLEGETMLWRDETDKMGMEMHRPATKRVTRYLRVWRERCPSKGWVFPAPVDATQPVPKVTVDKWPAAIYRASGLTQPKGSGWHSHRRKWASERRGYSIPDLMAAGGWASAEALMRYLKTDEATIAQVIRIPTQRVRTEVRTKLLKIG